jgi:hypothetical protein
MSSVRTSEAEGIGTRKEKSLHAALKRRYAGENGCTEISIDSFVCDAVREDGEIVEIQTGSFAPLGPKVTALAKKARVRIVHPVSESRTIETYSQEGTLLRSRKSPKRGSCWDLFAALVYAPHLARTPGIAIEVALVEDSETRVDDGRGSWRRKGVSIVDRQLTAVRGTFLFSTVADYARLLPETLPSPFSVSDLAKAAKIKPDLARKSLYVLTRLGVAEAAGKRGNAKLFVRRA